MLLVLEMWAELHPFAFVATLIVATVWSLFWKGVALWIAAREKERWWFVFFLLLNTMGLLEAIYIFAVKRTKLPWK